MTNEQQSSGEHPSQDAYNKNELPEIAIEFGDYHERMMRLLQPRSVYFSDGINKEDRKDTKE
jgi:hypothetical protein